MTNRKILPLAEPRIYSYSSHATALAIVSVDEDYLPWFHSNYIQLCGLKDYRMNHVDLPLDFYMGPRKNSNYYVNTNWLTFLSTERQLIESTCGDIIQYVLACIDQNHYVALYLDEFYMRDRWAYNRRKWDHENLIFGYDLEKQVFHIIGFKGTNRKFQASEISFDVFKKAYDECGNQDHNDWINLFLIRKVPKEIGPFKGKYDFDLDLVIETIEEFLESKDASKKFTMFHNSLTHFVFGLEVYDSIKTNLPDFWHDIRPMHVLVEHKSCMVDRIQYLKDNGYLAEEEYTYLHEAYSKMVRTCTVMRNMQLRYTVSKDREKDRHWLDNILTELDQLATSEKEVLERMLVMLKQSRGKRQAPIELK